MIRLDKFLTQCDLGSRSEVKKLLSAGRVAVEGRVALKPEESIPEDARVTLDGNLLEYRPYIALIMHKPPGYLTATRDPNAPTVLDLLPQSIQKRHPVPAGRLDKDTTGLLILTDRGDLVHGLISPKRHVEKTYWAELSAPADPSDIDAFAKGMDLGDFISLPARLTILPEACALAHVMEGKYHQVKRMFAARGKTVLRLKRLSMGSVRLPEDLREGEWRHLTQDEFENLCQEAGVRP